MKTYYFSILVILFFIAACSGTDNDTPQNQSGRETTDQDATAVDYRLYENLDVNAYETFDSLPSELQDAVEINAEKLFGLMAETTECETGCTASTLENTNTTLAGGLLSGLCSGACLLYHCWRPMTACIIDGECQSQLMSLGDCVFEGGDEMMLCFIATFSDPNDKLLEMMACLGGSGCMPEPEPDCAVPTNRDQMTWVTLADFEGDWYVVRGLSPVYDCFSGQRYSFHQISGTVSTYEYIYFPVEKDSPIEIQCTTTAVPFSSDETEICPGRFRVNYTAYGMPGIDEWYCLSHPSDDYVLIYYCGASAMDSYVGGVVLSRTLGTEIPENILEEFDAALENAGISDPVTLEDFSTPDNSGITY